MELFCLVFLSILRIGNGIPRRRGRYCNPYYEFLGKRIFFCRYLTAVAVVKLSWQETRHASR